MGKRRSKPEKALDDFKDAQEQHRVYPGPKETETLREAEKTLQQTVEERTRKDTHKKNQPA
jgi:phosphoglycerate-specific signal transduction histidine kinase